MYYIKPNKLRTYNLQANGGYITLMSVLIVGAIGTAIAVSIILLGLGVSRNSFALEQSNQAKALANSCAEEALQQIRNSTPFTGTGSLSSVQGVCEYEVINDGGQDRTINASGTVKTIVRKVKVTIDTINPNINIASWQEVGGF
jgi:hypothetical protein